MEWIKHMDVSFTVQVHPEGKEEVACVRRTMESAEEAEWLCSWTAGGREVLDHNLISFYEMYLLCVDYFIEIPVDIVTWFFMTLYPCSQYISYHPSLPQAVHDSWPSSPGPRSSQGLWVCLPQTLKRVWAVTQQAKGHKGENNAHPSVHRKRVQPHQTAAWGQQGCLWWHRPGSGASKQHHSLFMVCVISFTFPIQSRQFIKI